MRDFTQRFEQRELLCSSVETLVVNLVGLVVSILSEKSLRNYAH